MTLIWIVEVLCFRLRLSRVSIKRTVPTFVAKLSNQSTNLHGWLSEVKILQLKDLSTCGSTWWHQVDAPSQKVSNFETRTETNATKSLPLQHCWFWNQQLESLNWFQSDFDVIPGRSLAAERFPIVDKIDAHCAILADSAQQLFLSNRFSVEECANTGNEAFTSVAALQFADFRLSSR